MCRYDTYIRLRKRGTEADIYNAYKSFLDMMSLGMIRIPEFKAVYPLCKDITADIGIDVKETTSRISSWERKKNRLLLGTSVMPIDFTSNNMSTEQFQKYSDIFGAYNKARVDVKNLKKIWKHSLEGFPALLKGLEDDDGAYDPTKEKLDPAIVKSIAEACGVKSRLEAYASGVPIEDILA